MNWKTNDVYLVAAWDDFYPSPDNTLMVTSCYVQAYEYSQELKDSGRYDRVGIFTHTLQGQ